MEIFQRHIILWKLKPDGLPFSTHSSDLLPVRYGSTPAILKISRDPIEQRAHFLMRFWAGDGAARVIAYDDSALLLERAIGPNSLPAMVAEGRDDEASQIICTVAARLHIPRAQPPQGLVSLPDWFRELSPAARHFGGILPVADQIAKHLIIDPRDITVLHGDIHHENILDTGHNGWVAIDPKGLVGERCFDFANIFCNPSQAVATSPDRVRHQVEIVAHAAQLDRTRLLQWVTAYAGLSAAWILNDGGDASLPLAVAEIAAQELN